MFDHLRRDAAKYADQGGWHSCPGFWIIAIYRYGVWVYALPVWARIPFWLLYRILHLSYWLFNVHLWAGSRGSRLGPGLFLIHPNNVYFAPHMTLGEDCTVFHEVTLGMGHVAGTPRIGNNVTIFAGARVVGGVEIGDRVMIGANCVVMRSVPPDTTILPAPYKVLPRSLSPHARKADRASVSQTPDA